MWGAVRRFFVFMAAIFNAPTATPWSRHLLPIVGWKKNRVRGSFVNSPIRSLLER